MAASPPVDASAPRITPSRPSASSTAASSASRLPSHMASTSSGRVPATRVPSAKEDAASAIGQAWPQIEREYAGWQSRPGLIVAGAAALGLGALVASRRRKG